MQNHGVAYFARHVWKLLSGVIAGSRRRRGDPVDVAASRRYQAALRQFQHWSAAALAITKCSRETPPK